MEQQLIEQTINIIPQTMDTVLPQITNLLMAKEVQAQIMDNIVKSLFYGLWNFDKMINQHNLSTKIASLLHKLSKKNCFNFFKNFINYLNQKWNLIDHHRINKFMQLVRYLVRETMKVDKDKLQKVLRQTVFNDFTARSGLAYHIVEMYYEIVHENCKDFNFKNLTLAQYLLKNHTIEHFRLHIMEKVYQKYKEGLVSEYLQTPDQLQNKLNEFVKHLLLMGQGEEKDLNRRNMYSLAGYFKSQEMLLCVYLHQKQLKAEQQKVKKKKKISKHKKELIKQAKRKRKQKKGKKKKPQTSRRKFQMQNIDGV